ncbi:hypothetical protein SAMN04487969_11570 [Paenibacillus algorifonticola]|uniref:Uncharacterized protein n=1 Tax=Paenibacillus algorifonticola TaxID=684063 RepID=A0A1I2GA69_9BACL|nr:hypothetical protein SAMN04487969_11570 [Paenibacillus algorifonticola]
MKKSKQAEPHLPEDTACFSAISLFKIILQYHIKASFLAVP